MDILGINHSIDAAAALVRDGEILAAVTDERFTHEKHSRDFPLDSVRYCLRHGGVDLGDLECVAFFWNPGLHLQSLDTRLAGSPRHHSEYLWSLPNHLLAHYPKRWDELEVEHVEQRFTLKGTERPLRIVYVSHHMAHAASAFFVSPFEEAAILTVDGYGERASAMLGQGRGGHVSSLREIRFPHSLGAFYAAITQYLGFRPNCEEGTVMGLAAHGEPRFRAQLAEIVRLEADGGIELDLSYFDYYREAPRRYSEKFVRSFGRDRRPDEPIEDRHRDLAASAQAVLEDAMVHLARHLQRVTGARKLCMAGGVTLNCVANSRVLEDTDFEDAFIQPAAGDNGSSLGAALYVFHQILGRPRERVMETDFLGPGFTNEEIARELVDRGVSYERCDDIARVGAERIARGEVLGWFQGRMEFGPRALGHRSILADPRREETKPRLDQSVKRREPFRPYAPAVLREAHEEYFAGPGDSPFMLKNYSVRPDKRSRIPAVVHVDGSARVQTVDRTRDPLFWRLIKEFERLSGVPVVLNTSFNARGETMVCTVQDALRCFSTTGMDALALGDCLVRK
jgi:carbamoyltransferase